MSPLACFQRSAKVGFGALLVLLFLAGCGRGDRKSDERAFNEPPLCSPNPELLETGPLGPPQDLALRQQRGTGRFTLRREDDCARLVLPVLPLFVDSTAQAGSPGFSGAFARDLGVVRLLFAESVDVVTQADTVFRAGGPIAAAYVVHTREGPLALDVHLNGPALVRAAAVGGPPRLLVDAKPGGGAVPAPAASARNLVVLEPRGGAIVYPIVIRGYARTFEANVIARLSKDGAVVASTHGTAADWSMTWGEFELTIVSGPSGPLDLFVGENDAESGRERGVHIALVLP